MFSNSRLRIKNIIVVQNFIHLSKLEHANAYVGKLVSPATELAKHVHVC